MSVATALCWSEMVERLDVRDLPGEAERVEELQQRRAENLEDIQAAREQASRVGSMAGQMRYVAACREEIAMAESYLLSVRAPFEAVES